MTKWGPQNAMFQINQPNSPNWKDKEEPYNELNRCKKKKEKQYLFMIKTLSTPPIEKNFLNDTKSMINYNIMLYGKKLNTFP